MNALDTTPGGVRRDMAEAFSRIIASDLKRESEFEIERGLLQYRKALQNYSDALWGWVLADVPADLMERINKLNFGLPDTDEGRHQSEFARLDYLLRRAIALEGRQHGRAFDDDHNRFILRFGHKVDLVDDVELIRALGVPHSKPRKAGQESRQLKYYLILFWLAGGLWRMPSREAQWNALSIAPWRGSSTPEEPKSGTLGRSANSLNLAQVRLGLKWYKD